MNNPGVDQSQLTRLTQAIAHRVGHQRYQVWFHKSARFELTNERLEIAVPNDFISEWIDSHFSRPIQEAANEVLGCSLPLKFCVVPQLFDGSLPAGTTHAAGGASHGDRRHAGDFKTPGANPSGATFAGGYDQDAVRRENLSSRFAGEGEIRLADGHPNASRTPHARGGGEASTRAPAVGGRLNPAGAVTGADYTRGRAGAVRR